MSRNHYHKIWYHDKGLFKIAWKQKKKEATNSILSTRETWNEHNTQETAANKM